MDPVFNYTDETFEYLTYVRARRAAEPSDLRIVCSVLGSKVKPAEVRLFLRSCRALYPRHGHLAGGDVLYLTVRSSISYIVSQIH